MNTPKAQLTKPALVLLYGFPGAGKTHFARNITEHLMLAHVQADKIRHELFEEPRYDKQEDAIVKHLINYMTEEFLQAGVSVVYDMNAMRKSQRHELRELARKKGAKAVVVWFQVDPDTSFARLRKRDRRTLDDKFATDYTQQEFKKYASRMQPPEATEDYVVVSGKHNFSSQKVAFMKKIMDMGLIAPQTVQASLAKPGLINLIPKTITGRVDMSRRNINIR
jgi:predicted kinase